MSAYLNVSRRWLSNSNHHPNSSGLASTIRTQKPYGLAAAQSQRDAAHHRPAPEALADLVDHKPALVSHELRPPIRAVLATVKSHELGRLRLRYVLNRLIKSHLALKLRENSRRWLAVFDVFRWFWRRSRRRYFWCLGGREHARHAATRSATCKVGTSRGKINNK